MRVLQGRHTDYCKHNDTDYCKHNDTDYCKHNDTDNLHVVTGWHTMPQW